MISSYKNISNQDIGISFFYWEARMGRIFLANQILKELGYERTTWNVLDSMGLIDGQDKLKIQKRDNRELFDELTYLNVVQLRAKEVLMLTESGLWKIIIQSSKPIGIKTRHWLATEVLPSIREKGYYNPIEFESSPFHKLSEYTERGKQVQSSKNVNAKIYRSGLDNYSQYWNELHNLVTGMTAKDIKEFYKSKKSATEILRKYAPELQATESFINDIYNRGIGLDSVKESDLHKTLPPAFNSLFKLGIKFDDDKNKILD